MPWDPIGRLYPIVDRDVCHSRGLDPVSVAAACAGAGTPWLQFRFKTAASAALLATAEAVVASAWEGAARVIVNDRADIARLAGAGGVHVGQEDLPPALVRRVFPAAVIGLSTHDERQVDKALASEADYVAVGPIYETETKNTGYRARGLSLIRYAAGRGKPIVAIGGLTLATAPRAIDAGAAAVAVITDLLVGSTHERVLAYLRALA